MKNKIFAIIFIIIFMQIPANSFCWTGKPPSINPKSKIEYVNISWWDNFSDPYLKKYIIQSIENNHEAQKASWQVEEYKQFVKYQFSQELPSLSVGAVYAGVHWPDSIKNIKNNIFAIPFTASYEADIFLKNHDKTKSSKKAYLANRFQEKSVYISLVSDVATTYINILKFDEQIKIQHEIVINKKENLKRVKLRYKNGVCNAMAVNNAEKSYKSALSQFDEYKKSRDKSLNQLAVLIGESPQNSLNLERGSFNDFEYKVEIPSSIPSEVVFSRPDIMAAEANLEKAKIDIRVARKEFLPSLKVTGVYSLSNIGGTFGNWDSTIAGIVANAAFDLFKGGAKVANLKINMTRYEQIFQEYRQVDLNALKEVNDSLIMIRENTKVDKNTNQNLILQNDNYKRAQNSFKNGTISYTDLLFEQETFLNSKQNQVSTKTNRLTDYITLYKAVGGQL